MSTASSHVSTLTHAVRDSIADILCIETTLTGDATFGSSVRFRFDNKLWETGMLYNKWWALAPASEFGCYEKRRFIRPLTDACCNNPLLLTGWVHRTLMEYRLHGTIPMGVAAERELVQLKVGVRS